MHNINSKNQPIENKTADEAIYQSLEFYNEPKEYFTLALNEIELELGSPNSILDVGCSNGAFLHHTQKRFGNSKLMGIDPIDSLVELSRKNLNDINIFKLNILDDNLIDIVGQSSAVTMMGVMYLFSNPKLVIQNLLKLVKDDGSVFIFSTFNEEPVDVLLKYRKATNGDWIEAHNVFSMKTIASYCSELGASCRWVDFTMSKPIQKTSDPLRSWTEPFRDNPNHIVYGTNMFATMKLLVLKKCD